MLYILIILILLIYGYFTITKSYNYWKSKGINGPTAWPIVGNFGAIILMRESVYQYIKSVYHQYPNEKVVGLYSGFKPVLLIRDPDLIKQVLIKEFHLFQDRFVKTSNSFLSDNLFSAEGETWRILRQKLTPTFTSKKLRDMMPLMKICVDNFISHVEDIVQNKTDHEARSLAANYTLDVIGSCVFGLNLNVYSYHKNIFREMASKIFKPSLSLRAVQILNMIVPGVKKLFSPKGNSVIDQFFLNLVTDIVTERNGKPSSRKDFMDLLIELREQGRVTRRNESGISEIEIDYGMMAAQAVVFYSAGFETSSAAMSFVFYELALHPEIQDRVYKEICEVFKKYNGQLEYDAIKEMTYLKMVFDETLRKQSIAGVLTRLSSVNYTFPGTDITVEKGTTVFISSSGLNHDTKYFSDPGKFDPENFSSENVKKIPQCVYLPFGAGQRNCIGMRFAEAQSMMGIAGFLKVFKVEPSARTKPCLEYDPKSLVLTSKHGIWLNITKR